MEEIQNFLKFLDNSITENLVKLQGLHKITNLVLIA